MTRRPNPSPPRSALLLAGLLTTIAGVSVALTIPGEVDVFDRPTAPVTGDGRPVLVLYASRATSERVSVPATAIAERLADVPYVTIVRVDLRGVPGLFHGIARAIMRSNHADAVERSLQRAQRDGRRVVREQLAERLRLVADGEGRSHGAVGLQEGFDRPVALVLDPTGRELVRGILPDDRDALEAALAAYRPLTAATP